MKGKPYSPYLEPGFELCLRCRLETCQDRSKRCRLARYRRWLEKDPEIPKKQGRRKLSMVCKVEYQCGCTLEFTGHWDRFCPNHPGSKFVSVEVQRWLS